MSHAPVLSSSPRLPNDVMVYIVGYLDRDALAQMRLCSRWLAKEAARHLFAEVSFHMRAESMERVIGIANSSMIADAVKTLKLFETPRLTDLDEQLWYMLLRWDWAWDLEEDEGNHYDDPANEEIEQRRKEAHLLFLEYEAQRTEPTLYESLHAAHPPTIVWLSILAEGRLAQESRRSNGEALVFQIWRLQKAFIDLETALLKLRNLKEVQAYFTRNDDDFSFIWRNYKLEDGGPIHDDFYDLDRDQAVKQEAAPLAVLFRVLGKRNSSSDSLTSLRLDLRMDGWWGLQDLLATWKIQEGDGEEEEDEEVITKEELQVIVTKAQTFTTGAFYHLTDVHIHFNKRSDMTAFLNSLSTFLSEAKKLLRLELKFDIPNDRWQGLDMLCAINKHFQWPMLSHLSLQGFEFPGSSILQTFSSAAPTLQSFSLRNCMLHGGETPWSQLFKDMRRIPFRNLHRSEFRICEQDIVRQDVLNTEPQPWSYQELDARSIVLIRMKRGDEEYIMGYSSLIYDYILKRTDVMPPLQLFSTSAMES